MQSLELTEGKIGRTLLRFAIPFLLASVLQALYGAADLFVVGRFADSAAVSAVSVGSQVMQTVTGIILGISMGGTVLIGQYYGARDQKSAAGAIGSMVIAFSALAAILTPVMLAMSSNIVTMMHTPAEACAYAVQYLLICSCGIPFIVGYNGVSGIFRGLGDSKTPLIFVTIACIINIGLDLLLVGVFHMGAAGAAAATSAAQAISFLSALFYMKKRGFPFEFNRTYIKIDYKLGKILKIGSPLALQDALINISFLIITMIINSMGLIASASVGVVEKLIVFSMLPPSAMASAVATMTAQNIGAGKPERARKCLWSGVCFSLVFGAAFCAYCQVLPETLTAIFSADRQVVEMAALYLKSYSLDCIIVCFVFCMNSYFNGCGQSVFPMIHSMFATFFVRIPLVYAVSRIEGVTLYEIGFVAPFATLISFFICLFFLYYQKKKYVPTTSGMQKSQNHV
ncbi:MATE family efflux transporter [Anaerolentibacter hominis]|uniref:MATE family efflux transporter n=1 Tax=Anaerolentibacter hominis TaxID=3079009 RepID=UPI0031B82B9E